MGRPGCKLQAPPAGNAATNGLEIEMKKNGFTVVELIVVLGSLFIIGIPLWIIIHFVSKFW